MKTKVESRTRIDSLTPEESAQMPAWAARWTEIGLSTKPADRARAENAIAVYYKAAGLEPPKRIVWVPSLIVGVFAFPAASLILTARERMRRSGASVDASVGDSVGASVDDSVGDSVGASVRASVGASVRASVGASVDADPKVLAAYRQVLQRTYYRFLGGQFWVGYGYYGYWASPSMLSFFRDVCGLTLGAKDELVEAIIAIGESCCWWWPHKEFVMICERPQVIARDAEGRLHSETGPAAGWGESVDAEGDDPRGKPGWGVHAIHGVRVPAYVVEHPETITLAKIEAETNAEIRRIMIDRYGISKYVRDSRFEVLNEELDALGQPRRLLRKDRLTVVELTNSTVDADGTRRVYHIPVHPELRPLSPSGELGASQKLTALNAVASTYGLRGSEYVLQAET